jgi:hypothetical protein
MKGEREGQKYLIAPLDVELDLLAGERADPIVGGWFIGQ